MARLAAHLDATPRYVALAVPPDSGKTQLAGAIARLLRKEAPGTKLRITDDGSERSADIMASSGELALPAQTDVLIEVFQ